MTSLSIHTGLQMSPQKLDPTTGPLYMPLPHWVCRLFLGSAFSFHGAFRVYDSVDITSCVSFIAGLEAAMSIERACLCSQGLVQSQLQNGCSIMICWVLPKKYRLFPDSYISLFEYFYQWSYLIYLLSISLDSYILSFLLFSLCMLCLPARTRVALLSRLSSKDFSEIVSFSPGLL